MSNGVKFVGNVQPPADMMEAARRSLSPVGFENLMARTGGRAPTPAELVEFADAEQLAGVVPPYAKTAIGDVAASLDDVTADVVGNSELPPPMRS